MTSTLTKLNSADFFAPDKFGNRRDKSDSGIGRNSAQLELVSTREWDEIASQFADLIAEQMGSFNTGHWGEENMEFAVIRDGSKLLGGAAVIVKSVPFTNTGIAILKWGPLCQVKGQVFSVHDYCTVVDCLKQEYSVKRKFHLTIMPYAKPEVSEKCESSLLAMGFTIGEGLPAPERYIVNVGQDSEMLKASLDQKWRYNMRKAFKNNIEIKLVDAREGLEEFLSLYQQMIERKKFLDASAIGALEGIVHNSPAATRPLIALAYHEGRVTAGGVFHVRGNMASYMFGATDERALRLKAGYAMHWWMAEHLCKQEDIQWYDLGGNDLDKGLHQFKKGFVGKSGDIMTAPPRYHFSRNLSAKLVGFSAFRARSIVSSLKRSMHALLQRK